MRPKPVPMIPTPRGSLCPCAIDRLLLVSSSSGRKPTSGPERVFPRSAFPDPGLFRALSQEFVDLFLDHRPLEKARVHPCPQRGRVGEHKVAEVVFCNRPMLHQLIRLF